MKKRKKNCRPTHSLRHDSERNDTTHVLAVQSNLSPLVSELQVLNDPADQVQANWMTRGQVQGLEVISKKMILHVRPAKPILEGVYQYWTTNPLLQIQLFSAYLCGWIVDIFSIVPQDSISESPRNGGEILTIHVEQDTDQLVRQHNEASKGK